MIFAVYRFLANIIFTLNTVFTVIYSDYPAERYEGRKPTYSEDAVRYPFSGSIPVFIFNFFNRKVLLKTVRSLAFR